MPTPPLDPALLQEAVELWFAHDRSVRGAAEASGLNYHTYKTRLDRAKREGLHLAPGIRDSMVRAGLDPLVTKGGHRRIYDPETGRQIDTVRYDVAQDKVSTEDYLAQVRAALDGLAPAPIRAAPDACTSDLLTLYPLMDVHFGMHAWAEETGDDDYDIKSAASDMRAAFAKVLPRTPASGEAILLVGGDFYHADDNSGLTPAHKHRLDVDSRHFKVLMAGIEILADVMETLLDRHGRVTLRILRGNHDEHAHLIPMVALAERYRNHPRCTVEQSPRHLFTRAWGRSLIAAHHGDKGTPEQMVLQIADVCPDWTPTRHRFLYTGHTHKDQARDISGMKWESLRAFAPKDAYAAGRNYTGRRTMNSLTYHTVDGLVTRAFDPIERA